MCAPRLTVLVVGGGIGGLASAAMLRPIANVTILESAHELKEIGAAVTIGSGVVAILRGFGIHLDQKGGVPAEGFKHWDSDGNVIAFTPYRVMEHGLSEYPVCVHRSDLHSALLRAAVTPDGPGAPCTVMTSHKAVALDADAGIVKTANGESFQADAVICADGIHSRMRPFIIDQHVDPPASGESAYRFLLHVEDLKDVDHPLIMDGRLPPIMHMVTAQDRKLVAYPIRDGTILNAVAYVPDSSLTEPTTEKWTSKGSVDSLVKAYENFAPFWKNALATAREVGIWQIHDLPQLKTWSKGRAILIGDAAHAMLPHQGAGATSAIEDAEALAFTLRDATAMSVPSALLRTFAIRSKRAIKFQTASRARGLHGKLDTEDGAKALEGWIYPGAQKWAEEHPDMVAT